MFSQSHGRERVMCRVGREVVPGRLPYPVEPCNSSNLCSQKPHCRLLFLLSRFLVWPNMLQSALGGQVASLGMRVCVAKQNRCRKVYPKWVGGGGGEEERKWEAGHAGRRGIKPYLSIEGRALPYESPKTLLGFLRQVCPSLSNGCFSSPTLRSEWYLKAAQG